MTGAVILGAPTVPRRKPEIILPGASPARPKARDIIITPRLPAFPKHYVGMWASDGDIVAECETCATAPGGKRWHAMGPRRDVRKAVAEHQRMYHGQEAAVIHTNHPRQ